MDFFVPPLALKNRVVETDLPAFVMSIINCTPDSFWAGSRFSAKSTTGIQQTTEYALKQFELGASIIDIGAESTRPGSQYVEAEEEMERMIPLIQEIRKHTQGVISVDTRKSVVLQEALRAGADILNDVSALEDDSEMVSIVANEKIPVILMHKRGIPLTMQQNTVYNSIIGDVCKYLEERVRYATQHGVEGSKIILDAGIGFAKQASENIALITSSHDINKTVTHLSGIKTYGVLVGLSRKTCIGDMTGKPVEKRLAGTIAANMLAVQRGARFLRVHDTEETIDMLKVLQNSGTRYTG